MDHYRNITGFFPTERSEKCTDTVTFIPHNIPIPSFTMEDYLLQALDDIITILKTEKDTLPPTFKLGDKTRAALLDISKSLKSAVQPPSLPETNISASSAKPLVSESRVGVNTPPTVSETRVDLTKTNISSLEHDFPDDETIHTSNCSPPIVQAPISKNTVNTRSSFTGKRVPTIGTRFSKRLQDLKRKKN